jgi:hypothetical protein
MNDREKPKYYTKTPFKCHFVNHKSHKNWPGIDVTTSAIACPNSESSNVQCTTVSQMNLLSPARAQFWIATSYQTLVAVVKKCQW